MQERCRSILIFDDLEPFIGQLAVLSLEMRSSLEIDSKKLICLIHHTFSGDTATFGKVETSSCVVEEQHISRKRRLVDPGCQILGRVYVRTFSRPFRGRDLAGREISQREYRPCFFRAN